MVLVGGAPGDIVVSGEGLDAVMSQLLWQAETDGPPPLGADAIASLPEVVVSEQQEQQSMQCSVCWEAFVKGRHLLYVISFILCCLLRVW